MALKHFRRFKYTQADVDRVLKHLKLHNKITPNDLVTRPLAKPRRKGKEMVYDEQIPWVLPGKLKASFQDKDLKSGKAGKHILYGLEDDVWKRIVPASEVTDFLRDEILDPESRMPFGRDAAHHHLMKTTIGISRRTAYAFLEKQSVLQTSKNIPVERQKGGKVVRTRGDVEIDLIEGQGRDIAKELGKLHGDWYWLAAVDRLTGYGVVEQVQDDRGRSTKAAKWVAKALQEVLKRMEHALKAKVHTISSDAGREFFSDVKQLLVRRGIKQRQVPRGSRVEKYNQDFQRTFYRLLRLKRGTFSQVEEQAEEITNNGKNKYTKLSPNEALSKTDEELSAKSSASRQKTKPYKGKDPAVGDECRVLIKHRKNIRPTLKIGSQSRMHKSYLARHFAKGVHKIRKKMQTNKREVQADPTLKPVYRYYVNGRWADRDEIMLISGVDATTDARVRERK